MNFFFVLDGFLAVGSYSPYNIKAEVYDFGTGDWTTVQDYPYGVSRRYVAFYDMVYIPATSAYYVIGGYDGSDELSTIGMFNNGAWSKAGQLNEARRVSLCSFFVFQKYQFNFKSHQAQWVNEALIVAGGYNERSSEKCTFDENDRFTCVEISPILESHAKGVSVSSLGALSWLVPPWYLV